MAPPKLEGKVDDKRPFRMPWLDSCYQETLLPGSPWRKVKLRSVSLQCGEYYSCKWAQQINVHQEIIKDVSNVSDRIKSNTQQSVSATNVALYKLFLSKTSICLRSIQSG